MFAANLANALIITDSNRLLQRCYHSGKMAAISENLSGSRFAGFLIDLLTEKSILFGKGGGGPQIEKDVGGKVHKVGGMSVLGYFFLFLLPIMYRLKGHIFHDFELLDKSRGAIL